jgi:hypothetical protein
MAIIPGQATHVATCTTLFFRCLCILITASHRPLTCNDADCLPTHPCRQIQQPDTVIPGLDRNQSQQEDGACPSSRIRIRSQRPKPCHHDWRPLTKRLKSDDGAGTSSLAPPNSLDLVEWDWTVDAQLAAHPLVRAPALFPSPACRVPTVQNPNAEMRVARASRRSGRWERVGTSRALRPYGLAKEQRTLPKVPSLLFPQTLKNSFSTTHPQTPRSPCRVMTH